MSVNDEELWSLRRLEKTIRYFMSLNKLDLSIYLGGANSFYISNAILFGDLEHYL